MDVSFSSFLCAREKDRTLDVMLNEYTQAGRACHNGAGYVSSVGHSGTAGQTFGIVDIEHALRFALYVTLLGGLADSEHDLPPLAAISRNGRLSVLYRLASLIF